MVDRNLLNGTLDLDDETQAKESPTLSFSAAEDTTPNLPGDDLLDGPTLETSRDTNNVGGRVSVILEWDAEGDIDIDGGTDTVYRIEHSEDLIDWEAIDQEADNEFVADAVDDHKGRHIGLIAGTTHYYRVFASHERSVIATGGFIWTEASDEERQTTADADQPDPPTLDDPGATSETVIRMNWTPPGMDGREPVGYGMITGYQVEYSADGTNWANLVKVGPKLENVVYSYNNKTGKLTEKPGGTNPVLDFEHTGLFQNQTVYYRVSTINNARPRVQMSDTSFARSATTKRALASDDPGGLVVKARGSSDIMLMWNARGDDITAAPITGYKIESSPLNASGGCAQDWSVLVEDTMLTTTAYTHMGLSPETGQCYRIFGINEVNTSTSFVGFGDDYNTTNDNDAIAVTTERPNTAPTAGAAIADQTVMVDATVMVQSTITDADTGDTLTWTVMSNMPTYATADGGHHGYGNHHRRSGWHGHHHGDRHRYRRWAQWLRKTSWSP